MEFFFWFSLDQTTNILNLLSWKLQIIEIQWIESSGYEKKWNLFLFLFFIKLKRRITNHFEICKWLCIIFFSWIQNIYQLLLDSLFVSMTNEEYSNQLKMMQVVFEMNDLFNVHYIVDVLDSIWIISEGCCKLWDSKEVT